jgi:hypothetical protein
VGRSFLISVCGFILWFLSFGFWSDGDCEASIFHAGINVLLPPKAEIPFGTHHDCRELFFREPPSRRKEPAEVLRP